MKKIVAFILAFAVVMSAVFITSYAKTYDYIYAYEDDYPESEHNYQNDYFCTWEYSASSEGGLFVTFSEETSLNEEVHYVESEYGTQSQYDFIYISYPDGDSWEYISLEGFVGKDLSGKTLYVPRNRFRITLTTDLEASDYGFSIDRISNEPPENETTIRYHFTNPDVIDHYDFFGESEAEVSCFDDVINCGYVFAGWSTEYGGKTEYIAGNKLEAGKTYDLYAVWNKPIIAPEDTFSFLNGYVGGVYPAEDNYYMTDEHYNMMIGNWFKNFGIGPIPAPIVAIVLSTFPSWEHRGSCYGIATSVFLQYHGAIDFLEGTDAETMSEVNLYGETISRINYYQSLSAASFLCENIASQPGTPVYKQQLKDMFETVESGKPVLFSYYDYGSPYLISSGHSVVFVDAFTDSNGNHYLVSADSNYSYSRGVCHYYRISSDYSEFYDCRRTLGSLNGSRIGGFNWTADYEHFSSFDINGEGTPVAWHMVFFGHVFNWIKTVFNAYFVV